jgi:uncharacterized delta-60 repeat protein
MTLPAGQISLSEVNVELGLSATATISLNDAAVRSLAGVPSGAIAMSNLQGKSNVKYFIGLLGGSAVDEGYSVAVDSANNFYVGGQSTNSGTTDFQLAKYDNAGVIQWQRSLGLAASTNYGRSVATDSSNNIYACSRLDDATGTYLGLAKYNSSGTIQWQKKLGNAGGPSAAGYSVTVDTSNNIYVTGETTDPGQASILIAKYNTSGAVQWQRSLRNVLGDYGRSVDTDSSGNVYIAGYGVNYGESNNIIITKYNSSGTIQWQRKLVTSTSEQAWSIAIDSSGNSYFAGVAANSGTYDIQVAKYNSSGTIQFQRILGGFGQTDGHAIVLDSANNFYVCGSTYLSARFRIQIAKYNSSGTIQWQRKLGSSSANSTGFSIAVDSTDNLYVLGQTGVSGSTDFLIAKLPSDGSKTGTYTVGGYSFVYEASTLTDSASSLTESAAGYTDASASLTEANSVLTSATSTLTSTVTTL